MATIQKPPVDRIAGIQLIATLVAFSLFFLLFDSNIALSLVTGALVQIGPQAYFNRLAYRYMGASQTARILRGFYLGETVKICLSLLLFALVFAKMPWLHYPAFFFGYVLMMMLHSLCAYRMIR